MTRTNSPRKNRSRLLRFFGWSLALLIITTGLLAASAFALYQYLQPQLPDIEILTDIRYQTPMTIYSKDGLLMAQYGEKNCTPISIDDIPDKVLKAFLAAEDNRFFDHPGVDYKGLVRAVFSFVRTGEKRQGGSTITMQVARNFFLSTEKTFFRKIKEILLAIKIESKLPKRQILELYLNKIYFGHHAYGIVAASQVYYGKSVANLNLAEIAMIAGLPKAPSAFNPIVNPDRAISRRNYVLKRMLKHRYIDSQEFQTALTQLNTAQLHTSKVELYTPYVAEIVRNEIYQQFGESAYTNGYRVYTTIDSHLQLTAEKSLRLGLHDYDERHGYRGSKQRIDLKNSKSQEEWDNALAALPKAGETQAGLVVSVKEGSAEIYLGAGERIEIGWHGMRWARRYINENQRGPAPRSAKDVVKPGDIIRIRKRDDDTWMLSQIPESEGALVAMEPNSGAVLAIAGGYDFEVSKFNRATQAQRQPGSGFKPVLYAAAFANGYTPASVVNDAPIVQVDSSQGGGVWRPQNSSGRFYGPTRLRVALARSRNLVSVRLLKSIGLKTATDTALEFGFKREELPQSLSLALGSGSATPLRMAQVYSAFANGGFRVDPYFIEKIESDSGGVLFQATPQTACLECSESGRDPGNLASRVMSPQVHFMMHSVLQDVIRNGTAQDAMKLGRSDIAGKTGTTNEYRDAWFNGYAPSSLVAIAWIGFDSSKSLGAGETGGEAALPIWMRFMRVALKDVPEFSFPLPNGLSTARIDPGSGSLTSAGNSKGVFEVFPSDQKPRSSSSPRRRSIKPSRPGRSNGEFGDAASESAPAAASGARRSIESLF